MLSSRSRNALLIYATAVALFALAGAFLVDSNKWRLIIVVLYAGTIALLFLPVLRSIGIGVSMFLVVQTVAYDALLPGLKTLPAHMDQILWVEPRQIAGISGLKQVSTDKNGFRVSRPVDYREDRTIRIFALGASTTEQILLDDRETWTHLLQEELMGQFSHPVEVINTGVAGLRAVQVLDTMKKVAELHPDLLIFLLGVNDWNHHVMVARGALPGWSRLDFRESPLAHMMLSAWQAFSQRLGNELTPHPFVEWTRGRMERARVLPTVSFMADEVLPDYQDAMTRLAQGCREHDVPCLFLTQPNLYSEQMSELLQESLWMTPPEATFRLDLPSLVGVSRLYNDWLKEFACGEGMYFLDLAAHIPKANAYFYDDVHFTEGGAREVARSLVAPVLGILRRENDDRWGCPSDQS